MPVVQDEEFGKITIRRSAIAREVRIRVAPDGTLKASLPINAPLFLVKHLLRTSRTEIRKLLASSKPEYQYRNGMKIGKSHTLVIQSSNSSAYSIDRSGQQIIVRLPEDRSITDPAISRKLRDAVIDALRIEAKSYLPRRLDYLARHLGYEYKNIRFSHASGRWGSCSSNGTISLNIALMKLPFELIDYIIIHELTHTAEMNHSQAFWELVGQADPEYKSHRRELRSLNPSI